MIDERTQRTLAKIAEQLGIPAPSGDDPKALLLWLRDRSDSFTALYFDELNAQLIAELAS